MKDRFVLPTFWSEYSDLLQGEDEARMKHLSLYSLASHQVLSLDLSVGATGLLVGISNQKTCEKLCFSKIWCHTVHNKPYCSDGKYHLEVICHCSMFGQGERTTGL